MAPRLDDYLLEKEPREAGSSTLGVLGIDYPGLQPQMLVEEGAKVQRGQPLFTDKANAEVPVVAPRAGTVRSVLRGERRALLAVEIAVEREDSASVASPVSAADAKRGLKGEKIREALVKAGHWTAFRRRPYDRVPSPAEKPDAILVTCMDTRPYSADPMPNLRRRQEDVQAALLALTELTEGKVHLCVAPGEEPPNPGHDRIQVTEFAGPHPAGLPGTHIQHLEPLDGGRVVWTLDCRDLPSIGALLGRGELDYDQTLAVEGEGVDPEVLRVPRGVALESLFTDLPMDCRVVSGSPLYGHRAEGGVRWLGRYHHQACALMSPPRTPEFLNWLMPGMRKHSALNLYVASALRLLRMTGRLGMIERLDTSLHGSERGLVPVGVHDTLTPLDVPVVPLLRALLVGDTERSQMLGVLGMAPEDLSLMTYGCPSKYDYCSILRGHLDRIEAEG